MISPRRAALRASFGRSSAPSLPLYTRRAFHDSLDLIIFSSFWSHIIDKYTVVKIFFGEL